MKHKSGIYLNIASPEEQISRRMVAQVTLPGTAGRFTVLSGHAPLISSLTEGDIEYKIGDLKEKVHIKSGFVEVLEDTVSVCAETWEKLQK